MTIISVAIWHRACQLVQENLAKFKAALDAKGGELPAKFGGAKGGSTARFPIVSQEEASVVSRSSATTVVPESQAQKIVVVSFVVVGASTSGCGRHLVRRSRSSSSKFQ